MVQPKHEPLTFGDLKKMVATAPEQWSDDAIVKFNGPDGTYIIVHGLWYTDENVVLLSTDEEGRASA